MSYRAGTLIATIEAYWPHDMDVEDRTPANAEPHLRSYTSLGPEWIGKNQRMVVRLRDERGRELYLTPHELAINGVYA